MASTTMMKRVDVTRLVKQASIVLYGARRRGKTTTAKHMVYKMYKAGICQNFIAVCGNRNTASSWEQVLHPAYIWLVSNPAKNRTPKTTLSDLHHIMADQERLIKADRAEFDAYQVRMARQSLEYRPKEYEIPVHLCLTIIFDDCGGTKAEGGSTFINSDVVETMANEGRHYGITFFILCQHWGQTNRPIRDNSDYVGLFNTNDADTLDVIRKKYVSTFYTPREWRDMIAMATEPVGHMCWIDVCSSTRIRSEKLYINVTDYGERLEQIITPELRAYLENPVPLAPRHIEPVLMPQPAEWIDDEDDVEGEYYDD